jgi:tripeptide aminopeptidase
MNASAHQRIVRIASLPAVHRAFQWLHLQERRFRQWQIDLTQIPGPPFGEAKRAAWMLEQMRTLGLSSTGIDGAGNAIGYLRPPLPGEPLLLLSAHIDTVFPQETSFDVREEGDLLYAPGICDNGAGVAGLLALAGSVLHSGLPLTTNILFAANVGEEAEGNLRGMRYLFHGELGPCLKTAIALEGSGTETVVTRALGSKRFQVTITGPGGHSWTDAGRANPIVTLARAIAEVTRNSLLEDPRTTINVGTILGGTSVTAIPETATALFDLRSVDEEELLASEVRLFRAVEDAVLATNLHHGNDSNTDENLRFNIRSIGDRPAASLSEDSDLFQTIQAVDRHLGIRTSERVGSTDANLPLSLGVQAVAIGAGGRGGGIHTVREWYDPRGREMALRRILLTLVDRCEIK